ncbi:MAG: hypothetical protein KJ941_05300 [Bacteroidetes bacterium]|nr:hypothetical protein [Bacteroidota bacterium]
MFRSISLFVLLMFLSFGSFGQKGQIEIIKDPRLDFLVKKQGMVVPPATSPQITGYRLQLFFDSDRKKVEESRGKFIATYPKIDTYMTYSAPNYILKVGDFRHQHEVEKIKNQLISSFPTCFVVRERVNLPRID